MSSHQPSREPYPPPAPSPVGEVVDGEAKRVVALAVYVELSPDSQPEHDAAALLRALHHATLGDVRDHIVEESSEGSALLVVPERPTTNPNLLRAITTDALTERQKEVAYLIGDLTGPEIAARLGLSGEGVKTLTQQIFRRLGVNSRTAAAAVALGHLGTPEEADSYWAGATIPSGMTPLELPTTRKPLQPRQKEMLRSIFGGATVNTLAAEFDAPLVNIRRSLSVIARRLDLDESAGAHAIRRHLQENIVAFDFLESEQP